MKPRKILFIFCTRPEAIKMAPVIRELRSRAGEVETVVCATGQHREMLEQVIGAFGITPDLDLNLMRAGQTLAERAPYR